MQQHVAVFKPIRDRHTIALLSQAYGSMTTQTYILVQRAYDSHSRNHRLSTGRLITWSLADCAAAAAN
jgi:hypothetical protein